MNIVTRIMAALYWLTGLDQTWWINLLGGAGGRKFVLALIGFVGIILHNKFGITLTDTEVGALATLIISAIGGISYTDGQSLKARAMIGGTMACFILKNKNRECGAKDPGDSATGTPAILTFTLLLLIAFSAPRAATAADGGEVIPSPVPAVAPLDAEELAWVRLQYVNSIVDQCVSNVYAVDTDARSGAVTNVQVDPRSRIAILIQTKCCKSKEEFELHRFEAIYKDADAKNKVRVWDGNGEAAFLRHILQDKIAETPSFVQDLRIALKETLDAKSKASK